MSDGDDSGHGSIRQGVGHASGTLGTFNSSLLAQVVSQMNRPLFSGGPDRLDQHLTSTLINAKNSTKGKAGNGMGRNNKKESVHMCPKFVCLR
eukprot:scaffold1404_cov76-Skeletonema_dohrnii-CCMP3373.AAC.4